MRRQGSGTFVGQSTSWTLDEGLEKLVSYSELARRRGVRLEIAELSIEEQRLGPERGELFGLDPDTPATTFTRVLLMDGQPGARMRDVVHPEVELPSPARLRQTLERGEMVLDVLLGQGVPVAYARTHVMARLLTKPRPRGQRARRDRDDGGARDRARALHGRGLARRALDRHLPPAEPRSARRSLARGRASRARDRALRRGSELIGPIRAMQV